MLFTFPSQYWFSIGLSGCLALPDGAKFRPGVSDPALLRILPLLQRSFYGAITLFARFPPGSCRRRFQLWSYNPSLAVTNKVWALICSLATTGQSLVCFLSLRVLRCFSSWVCFSDLDRNARVQHTGFPGLVGSRPIWCSAGDARLITYPGDLASESLGLATTVSTSFNLILPICSGHYFSFNKLLFWLFRS